MAADNSTARKGGTGGGPSAESYIGSLIILTSKSEVRYEGVLLYINTEEPSIGLRNVRSFGTEGRKKDGPQVPPSDIIYEYMLFRGSDIKDLQVKTSAPVQRTPPINSDPAIIQSHYSHPTNTPMNNLPAAPNGSLVDQDSHSSSMGLPSSTFQSNLPLYQPGTNLNSWAPSPLYPNGGGLAMPMYWQGFYGSPNVMPQQTLLRPPSFLSDPPSMQQMQFSGFSSSAFASAPQGLPTSNSQDPQLLLTANNTSSSSTTSTLPASTLSLNMPSLHQLRPFESETMINQPQNVALLSSLSTSTPVSSFPSLASLATSLPANSELPSFDSKPSPLPGPASLPQPNITEPRTSLIGTPPSHLPVETLAPSLVTPGELLQSGIATVSSSQPSQAARKDVEVLQASLKHSPEPSAPVATETQPHLLPLPPKSRAHKPNGGGYHMRSKYRGRAVRGSRVSRPVTKFTEDFDFTAMNEKFNKDEVWGHLGKKAQSKDKKGSGTDSDSDDSRDEDDNGLQNFEIKAVYNKDDFFDSLSSNASNNGPNHVRTRYSERMKLDTETFGDFTRYRGGRGYNRGGGGGRFCGSYYRVRDPANRGRGGRGRGQDTKQNRS